MCHFCDANNDERAMGKTTTTTTTKEEEEEEEETEEESETSLELARDALRSANEEILEEEERERGEEGFSSSNVTSTFDLLEKVLAKCATNTTTREDEDEKTGKKTTTTQKKKKICTAKDVASEFSRKWTREHALLVWSDYNGKDSGKGWYEKECFLADVALTVNDYWLQNGLQMEFPLFAGGSSGTSKEDGEDIFSWKCAKISLNNVKAFVAVVMNWPKGKKTSGQNLIEDLKRVREKGLAKKGCKKPLRT